MSFILCFAVGAMLGDLFFHLIPESYQSHLVYSSHDGHPAPARAADVHKTVGLSIIAGIFMFIIVEQVLERWSDAAGGPGGKRQQQQQQQPVAADARPAGSVLGDQPDLNHNYPLSGKPGDQFESSNNNNYSVSDMNNCHPVKRAVAGKPVISEADDARLIDEQDTLSKVDKVLGACAIVDPAGYLNLIANSFDNFTHGLAIGASFLVGAKVGLLTTFVIFIHEVPHEICDYAILVNSGFSRLDAVKAQSSVSLFSLLGTAIALYVRSVETLTAQTLWILPFSAGGFLYIALVNLLPEILDSTKADPHDTLVQIACVILGISFMAAVAVF